MYVPEEGVLDHFINNVKEHPKVSPDLLWFEIYDEEEESTMETICEKCDGCSHVDTNHCSYKPDLSHPHNALCANCDAPFGVHNGMLCHDGKKFVPALKK